MSKKEVGVDAAAPEAPPVGKVVARVTPEGVEYALVLSVSAEGHKYILAPDGCRLRLDPGQVEWVEL